MDLLSDPPYLSVIVPVKNEEPRIGPSLRLLVEFLDRQPWGWEVVVVDSDSTDGTREAVEGMARERVGSVRYVRAEVSVEATGKGGAVGRGMVEARGRYLLMTDCDLPISLNQFEMFLAALEEGYDIAIASRRLPGALACEPQPWSRRVFGRLFSALVSALLLPGVSDSQCGFKLFRAQAGKEIFGRLTVFGFSFDVEVLLLAGRLGYRVKEIPVEWHHREPSSVRMLSDGGRMLADLVRLWWRYVFPHRRRVADVISRESSLWNR